MARLAGPAAAPPARSPAAVAAALAILAAGLAGCLAPQGPPGTGTGGGPGPGPGAVAAAATRFACPPGPAATAPGGLCVVSFASPASTYEEPYLAVDPADPRRMALGLNSWHAAPLPAGGPAVPGPGGAPAPAEVGRLVLFVTEDAGAAWREVPIPGPRFGRAGVGALHWTGDPALAFDRRGVLHLTQLNLAFEAPFWFDVQYASSPDLGRTWTGPLLLTTDGDSDRNWLTIAPDDVLHVTWRNQAGDGAGEWTWSRDGGATWAPAVRAPAPCGHLGRVLSTPAGLRLVCVVHGEGGAGPQGFRAFAADPAAGALVPLGDLPRPPGWAAGEATFSVVDAREDGVLAHASRQATPSGFLTVSPDAGATWGPPRLLTELCGCGGAPRLLPHWVAFDREGALHLILGDLYPETPDRPNEDNARYAAGDRSVWHLVLDPADLRVLGERRLAGPGEPRVPPTLGPPIARDDYHGAAFWPGGGALAWTRDRGIDLAWVLAEPVAGAAAPGRGARGGASEGQGPG